VGIPSDLKYAFRMLRKDQTFALVAVLSLALGTGANSTMFSFLNGLLLRPLAVSRPGEVWSITPKHPDNPFAGISYPDYVDYRDHTKTMKDLVASTLFRFGFSRSADALPQVKYGLVVSGNLFQAMGVMPVLGRAFRPEEGEVAGREPVVVLGYDFWKDEFGGDTHVIGRVIRLTGLDFTVIGIAPQTFTGMDEFFKVALFVPLTMIPRLSTDPNNNLLVRRDWREFFVRGRLQDGVTPAQAEAEMVSIANALAQQYPATNAGQAVALRSETQMHVQHMPQESGLMLLAMIMAALVLIISCFNVANMLLSRARTREVAVRLALGSSRMRLVRQLLTESLLLGIAGTAAGLWFAWIAARLFNRIKLPSDMPFMIEFRSDYRVLLYSLAAGLLSVVFFGLAPALQSSKVNLVPALKSMDAAIFSGRNQSRLRALLVIGQIAISVVLLIAGAMVYRGFNKQLFGRTGFRTSHVLMMSFDPRLIRYDDAKIMEFYRRLTEQAASAPGVKSVAMGITMPFAINQRALSIPVIRDNDRRTTESDRDYILHNAVDEHFFETMAVSIVRGRAFTASDTADSPPVVIVNEVLANKYWPGLDAIGKPLRVEMDGGRMVQAEVVGIAKTSQYVWPTEAPTEYLYLPITHRISRARTLFVESYGDAASLTPRIREVVAGLDPNMPAYDVRTIEEYFSTAILGSARVTLSVVGSMGSMGLILAMIGLYGLVTYSVSRRTREFGIRMAIGASKGRVLGMVLRQGALLCAAGLIAGIGASVPMGRVLQAFVFGASSDWMPYAAVPILLAFVTLAAIYGPARRASTIDPMQALRDE